MAKKKKNESTGNPLAEMPLPSLPKLKYKDVSYLKLWILKDGPMGDTLAHGPIDFSTEEDVELVNLPPSSTISQIQTLLRSFQVTDVPIMIEYIKVKEEKKKDENGKDKLVKSEDIVDSIRIPPVGTNDSMPQTTAAENNSPPDQASVDTSSQMKDGMPAGAVSVSSEPMPIDDITGAQEEPLLIPQPPPDLSTPRKRRGGASMSIEQINPDDMVIPAGLNDFDQSLFVLREKDRAEYRAMQNQVLATSLEVQRATTKDMTAGLRDVISTLGVHNEVTNRLRADLHNLQVKADRRESELIVENNRLLMALNTERAMRHTEVDTLRIRLKAQEDEVTRLTRQIDRMKYDEEVRRRALDDPEKNKMFEQLTQMAMEKFGPRFMQLFDEKVVSRIAPETKTG